MPLDSSMASSRRLSKGTPGRDLLPFAGTMDDESARQMTEAIDEGCERVDLDEG